MSVTADKLAHAVKGAIQRESAHLHGNLTPPLPEDENELLNVSRLGVELCGNPNFSELGLNDSRVSENRVLYGSNEVELPRDPSYLMLVREIMEDPTLRILLFSAVVSLVLGMSRPEDRSGIEGMSVLLTVMVVVNVQAVTNYSKAKEFRKQQEELESRKSITAIRDGQLTTMHPKHLVVGDVIRAKVGTVIPADGLVISGEIWMDESSLTGEPTLVHKVTNTITVSGTNVMRGEAHILVIAVGERSISGRILSAIISEHSEASESVLFRKLDRLAIHIGRVGIACALFVFVALLLTWLFACRAPKGSTLCESNSWQESLGVVLDFFITAVTVLVVAVPEGLPLAVTLALAVALEKLLKDRNQVKRFDSCETMGSATTICSDKTGTLTENKMKVVNQSSLPKDKPEIRDYFIKCLALAVSPDSKITPKPNANDYIYEGNPTECALLRYCSVDLGTDYKSLQKQNVDPSANGLRWGSHLNPFSSERKMMSILIQNSNGDQQQQQQSQPKKKQSKQKSEKSSDKGNFIMFAKGAPNVLLSKSTTFFHPKSGEVAPLDDTARDQILHQFSQEENQARRVLGFAVKLNVKTKTTPEDDLTFLGWVSLEDPLRDHIVSSVKACRKAGVVVRMITGDSLPTARAIARQAGILFEEEESHPLSTMTGAEFDERVHVKDHSGEKVMRRTYDFEKKQDIFQLAPPFLVHHSSGKKVLDERAFDEIWPHLRVLARCEPEDKLTLVKGLKGSKLHQLDRNIQAQVVAVTGDGTNDAPSLKAADIGFAMGIAGTDVAKQAADVIVLDDSFNSIVRALVWGRNVHDSVCKFLQFQMTVNLSAVIITSVGSLFLMKSPMTATQMLWVNMIMDSLGSLALATMKPNEESLLSRPPIPKHQNVISLRMAVNIVGQSALQLVILLTYLFQEEDRSDEFYTIVFNTFVMFQLVNEFNCKSVTGRIQERYMPDTNWQFLAVWLATLVFQIAIVQKLGLIFSCVPLSFSQWTKCLLIGLIGIPWQIMVVDPIATLVERHIRPGESVEEDQLDEQEVDLADEEKLMEVSQRTMGANSEHSPLLNRSRGRVADYEATTSPARPSYSRQESSSAELEENEAEELRLSARRRWALLRNTMKFTNAVRTSGGSQSSRFNFLSTPRRKRSASLGSMRREPVVSRLIHSISSRSLDSAT